MKSKHPSLSQRTANLKQSGIRAANTRCTELGGIDLGQGVCKLPVNEVIKEAAKNAIDHNKNMYSPNRGLKQLREQLAVKIKSFNKINANPNSDILVSHGAIGAFVCAVQALFDPGDEVIVFEPYYGYHQGILALFDINISVVKINLSDFSFDINELKEAISNKTKGIIVCTPNNPTGKVFTRNELLTLGAIAEQHNLFMIVDEIYEYITYPEHKHISCASLSNNWDRTITISGFSKTYHLTGWRLGYAYGPAEIITRMSLVQDLLYICPTTPLQYGTMAALSLKQEYYDDINKMFLRNRELVVAALRKMGFKVQSPQGAYYLMVDFSALPFANDEDAVNQLLEHAKVATVTGRSFFCDPNDGKYLIRVCYALNEPQIKIALEQMQVFIRALGKNV